MCPQSLDSVTLKTITASRVQRTGMRYIHRGATGGLVRLRADRRALPVSLGVMLWWVRDVWQHSDSGCVAGLAESLPVLCNKLMHTAATQVHQTGCRLQLAPPHLVLTCAYPQHPVAARDVASRKALGRRLCCSITVDANQLRHQCTCFQHEQSTAHQLHMPVGRHSYQCPCQIALPSPATITQSSPCCTTTDRIALT
jgi:hypothetical protein